MPGPTILIAGGYDKGSTYDEWIESFGGKVKYLVLIGQTREKIAAVCQRARVQRILCMRRTWRRQSGYVRRTRTAGDCVLLSPACASWGMFKDYEERGRIFKECVRQL